MCPCPREDHLCAACCHAGELRGLGGLRCKAMDWQSAPLRVCAAMQLQHFESHLVPAWAGAVSPRKTPLVLPEKTWPGMVPSVCMAGLISGRADPRRCLHQSTARSFRVGAPITATHVRWALDCLLGPQRGVCVLMHSTHCFYTSNAKQIEYEVNVIQQHIHQIVQEQPLSVASHGHHLGCQTPEHGHGAARWHYLSS